MKKRLLSHPFARIPRSRASDETREWSRLLFGPPILTGVERAPPGLFKVKDESQKGGKESTLHDIMEMGHGRSDASCAEMDA